MPDPVPSDAGEPSAGTRQFIGKAPRSAAPRACDRCRKRKARCDEKTPCRNCTEAGVKCTHEAPVLKRGPRPRPQPQDLESRLRNLEHLISSIPGGTPAASTSLSRGELDQIRSAAHLTPNSDASPPADGNALYIPNQAAAQWTGGSMSSLALSFGDGMDILPSSTTYASDSQQQLPIQASPSNQSQHIQDPFFNVDANMTAEAGPSNYNASQQPATFLPPASVQYGAPPNVAPVGQDLLYRDVEGQTKWLGPSSGMPLLDLLKTSNSVSPPPLNSGLSLAEEWMSLSVAIGLEVDQIPKQEQGDFTTRLDRTPDTSAERDALHRDSLWPRVLEVCPQDLLDILVRAYFTISHILWPILHAPTFMTAYNDPTSRRNPSFVALVLSICCLSSRYAQDSRISAPSSSGLTIAQDLFELAKNVLLHDAAGRADLQVVQAQFNLSVVQEGTARPNLLWSFLSQAVSIAMDIGLHRRVDDWGSFDAVEIEVRKRTLWALYCQNVKASCTYGRPPILRLCDIDLEEPFAVDDVYISVDGGIGTQPLDRPSIMAGFVATMRLHMVLERTIERINRVKREWQGRDSAFMSLVSSVTPQSYHIADELQLLQHVTDDIPGDWNYTQATVSDVDSVRFFQKTRVFTLQHFIRLLVARHRFEGFVAEKNKVRTSSPAEAWQSGSFDGNEQVILQQITQFALVIIGTYSVIQTRGRLYFFGAHAIAQITQAAAGLISVILYLRTPGVVGNDHILALVMQGLPASIQLLFQLGKRRPAGLRSAELLAEFSRACRIPIFVPGADSAQSAPGCNDYDMAAHLRQVEVPMLRALPRRISTAKATEDLQAQALFDEWMGMALQSSNEAWMSA